MYISCVGEGSLKLGKFTSKPNGKDKYTADSWRPCRMGLQPKHTGTKNTERDE